MLVWKRRAANLHRANRKKTQNAVRGKLFCPVFSAKPLSNGDLRMRGRRHFYHIIFLPSWSWLGIIKSPQFLDINLECRHLPRDFHQQWMLFWKFSLHFGHILFFFGGCSFFRLPPPMDFFHIACRQKPLKNQWKKTKAKENQQKNQRKPMTNKNNDKTNQNTWMTNWNQEEKGRTKKNTENHKKIMNKGKNTYWIWRRILNSKKKVLENWLAF